MGWTLEQQRKWRADNREHLQRYERARYERIREEKLAQMKEYHIATYPERREKIVQKVREHRASDPERHREMNRAWGKAYRERHRERFLASHCKNQGSRRARKMDSFVEQVHRDVVLERSAGICGICQEAVDPSNFHVDHIVPLARGGEHSYANTQAAHPGCNLRKGIK